MNSSSLASSSTASATTKTEFTDFTPDLQNGKTLYEQQCQICHGEDGTTGQEIDLTQYPTNGALHRYIEDYMPKVGPTTTGPKQCAGQCSADITAYMDTWRKAAVDACSDERPILYGERSLKLLTENEYQNSIQDLFPTQDVPAEFLSTLPDIKIGKFPNHHDAVVISGRARAFQTNAENIADWAVEGNYLGSCDSAAVCASTFINDFAYRAFRRPLTSGPSETENEVAQYKALFDQAPTPRDGLRWAIVTVLTSPNFLYRSELGIPVQQALDEGFGAGSAIVVETQNGTYVPSGDGRTVNGKFFSQKSNGKNTEDGWGYIMSSNGDLKQRFQFDNPSIITVRVKGNDSNGQWPRMRVIVNQREMGQEVVEGYEEQVFNYLYDGQAGEHDFFIRFENDSGSQPPNVMGKDVDLIVGDITVAPAEKQDGASTGPVVELTSLEQADPAAFVLTPYEYASALSYTFTGSTPDAELMLAAKSGQLNQQEEVLKQIERLLKTDSAERHIKQFSEHWMRTDHMLEGNFMREHENFNNEVRDAMIGELRETFWHVFNDETVPFSEMYNADYIFANKTLADFYSVNWPGGNESEFKKISTTERGGVTTMGAFLANWAHPRETSPILRAVNVRENMLCHHIDPPPETNIAERKELAEHVNMLAESGTLTTREYYRLITTHPQCDSCHLHDINPLGFGLESFDNVALPRAQQEDSGGIGNLLDVDSEGVLFGPEIYKDSGTAIDFSGPKALGNILAESSAVQACITEKFFRMAVGRPVKNSARDQLTTERELSDAETLDYGCAHEKLNTVLDTSNQDTKAMFKALGELDLIRFRR